MVYDKGQVRVILEVPLPLAQTRQDNQSLLS